LSGKNHRRLGGIRHDRSVRDCQMPRAIIDKPAFVQIIAAGLECSQGDPAQVFRIGQRVSHDILEVGKIPSDRQIYSESCGSRIW
jgi:hypothetical protein